MASSQADDLSLAHHPMTACGVHRGKIDPLMTASGQSRHS